MSSSSFAAAMTTSSSAVQSSRAFESVAPTLTKDDVERFGRQMLVEEIGASHMEQIRHARVVCVGAGGLGSTILLYLAAAGVGQLTIVDFDDVELSNLHRQVIHTTDNIGRPKAESAKEACLRLFPSAHVRALTTALTPANAEGMFRECDVVVDGTDNVAARYLINDAAMRCRVPLVSGSAMGWDGQLSVYGYKDGPCYRCLFPTPPPPETVGSCNDSGVVGPLPGMIGCLQALETLKVITGVGETLHGRLFVFNGLRFTSRVVKLRGRQPHCITCGAAALEEGGSARTPLTELAGSSCPEYVATTTCATTQLTTPDASCAVEDFAAALRSESAPCLVLDVRVRLQYDMAHLPHSLCVPYNMLLQWDRAGNLAQQLANVLEGALESSLTSTAAEEKVKQSCPVYVVCRRGINSVKAVNLINSVRKAETQSGEKEHAGDGKAAYPLQLFHFRNVTGGLNAYHAKVDQQFPYY